MGHWLHGLGQDDPYESGLAHKPLVLRPFVDPMWFISCFVSPCFRPGFRTLAGGNENRVPLTPFSGVYKQCKSSLHASGRTLLAGEQVRRELGTVLGGIGRKDLRLWGCDLLHPASPERSNSRPLKFWSLRSREGAEIRHMLLLNANRKPCMGSPMALSYLTLSDLERANFRSLVFRSLLEESS